MTTYPLTQHFHDILIVGGGGAGLRAATAACERAAGNGLKVACISKVPVTRSHTVAAQGGINAALGNRMPDDWRWHMYDTIRGSDWLGDQDAIALMCERAPEAIIELEHMGMPFTRDGQGQIYQRAYGGQSVEFGKGGLAYRACAVADRTGHSLIHTLYTHAMRHDVEFFIEYIALDLLFDDEQQCCGLLAWHLDSGELHVFRAHTVILATGGFGQAYASTTASTICTGDGNAMVLRAGLPLQDMEFIQFHPTGLHGTGILVTEGARGEGAYLLNGDGERFMQHYAPQSMELASRDVISRAMMQEILAGRGAGPEKNHLLLSLAHLKSEVIDSRLPSIKEIARTFAGLDIYTQPVPVLPAVHYTMGGIPTDMHSRVVTIDGKGNERIIGGLLAIGEAACTSVHGANRLGCNGLLELVVFGRAAGELAADGVKPGASHRPLSPDLLEPVITRFDDLRSSRGSVRPGRLRKQLQHCMQTYASIFRNEELLQQGLREMRGLWATLQNDLHIADSSLLWNTELVDAIETDNLMRQAMATLACAQARPESRGAHWRQDYPTRDDVSCLAHSVCFVDDNGNARFTIRSVRLHAEDAQSRTPMSFPPEVRAY